MTTPVIYSDEIDLRKVLKGLLSRKKWIIRGVGFSTIISIVIVFLLPPSFESTGFFRFSSVSIPTYKYYTGVFEDIDMLRAYITEYHEDTTWMVTADIFDEDGEYEPVYGYGKNPKNLMKENTVLGVKIRSSATTAKEAQQRVETLGAYLQTCMVNMEIWKYYAGMSGRLNSGILGLKSEMMGRELDLEILNNKIELLNANFKMFSSVTETYDRQVVKLDETTEKYLPLPQQLIASMISLNNLDIAMDQIQRTIHVEEIVLGYVRRIETLIEDKGRFLVDKELLDDLITEKESYFAGQKNNRDTLRAMYRMESKLQEFSLIKIEQFKFISGPLLPQTPGKPIKSMVVITVFFAALVVFVTYSLFVSWWNRSD